MSKNECETGAYKGGAYYANPYYPKDKLFNLFLSGTTEPLITEINKEQYNHLTIHAQYDYSKLLDDNQLNHLSNMLLQVPSVTAFVLKASLTSEQATKLASAITQSNICYFDLQSNALTNTGMTDYIKALSLSNVAHFSLSYAKLDDTLIDSMKFEDTTFTGLNFCTVEITDYGFSKLFQNLYGTEIDDVFIDGDFEVSSKALDEIDFSKTNIKSLEFSEFHFQNDALAHLNFKNSPVEKLYLFSNGLNSDSLGYLSKGLQESNINHLDIVQGSGENLDFSQLCLRDTNIETLRLSHRAYTKSLENLDLTGSNVKTLDLSYGSLNDEHIKSLNLKGTNVEHLILDYNNAITENGINTLKDIIKDTHIIDVSLSTYITDIASEFGNVKEFVLHNDHVLPSDEYLKLITPKTIFEPLDLTDIITQPTLQNDSSLSNIDAAQSYLTSHVDRTLIITSQNPLGAFEPEVYEGLH